MVVHDRNQTEKKICIWVELVRIWGELWIVRYVRMKTFPEKTVSRELKLIPHRHRRDAYQRAWLAFLAGRSAVAGVINYAKSERIHEERESATEPEHIACARCCPS